MSDNESTPESISELPTEPPVEPTETPIVEETSAEVGSAPLVLPPARPAPPPPPRAPSEFVRRMTAMLASRGVEKTEAIPQDDGSWLLTALYLHNDYPEGAEIIRSDLAPAFDASFRLEGLVSRVRQDGERFRVEFRFSEV